MAAPTHAGSDAPVGPRWRAVALAVVSAALAVRCAYPSWIDFGGEQIEAVTLAWRSLHESPAVRGLRVSNGVDMPPLYVWITSIPVLFTTAPIALSLFVAGVNALALGVLHLLVRRTAGERAAWIATILMASSTWAILFARRLWAQDFLFPLLVAAYAAIFAWRARPSAARAAAAGLALGLALQIYPSAWFVLPPLAAWAWIARLRPCAAHAAVALAAALVPWIPYALYRLDVGFPDVASMLASRAARGDGAADAAGVLGALAHHAELLVRIAGGTQLADLLGARPYATWSARADARVLGAVAWVIQALFVLVVVAALVRLPGRVRAARGGGPQASREALALLSTLVALGLVGANALLALPGVPHYLIAAYPALPVLAALELDRLARGPRAARLVLLATAAAALVHLGLWLSIRAHVARGERGLIGRYVPVYALARETVDRELGEALDEARHGRERRARAQAEQAARFLAATEVRLAWDAARDEPPLDGLGTLRVERGPDGVTLELSAPPFWFAWPRFELGPGELALARLELDAPIDTVLLTFPLSAAGAAARTNVIETRLARGRQTVYLELDGDEAPGGWRTHVSMQGTRILGLEVRRVAAIPERPSESR